MGDKHADPGKGAAIHTANRVPAPGHTLMTGSLKLLLAGLALLSAVGHFGGFYRLFELASHFRFQYLLLAVVLLALFAARRELRWAALGLGVVILNGYALMAPNMPGAVAAVEARAGHAGVPVRLLLANLQFSNVSHEAFTRLVGDQQPDVIVAQEVTPAWAGVLAGLRQQFPASKLVPREGAFGIGILSRWPMREVAQLNLGHPRYPALLARIKTDGGELSLLAVHPPPPINETLFAARNDQLHRAAAVLRGLGSRSLLLGDLNTSPWSPFFSGLLQQSGFRNARDGFGLLPTWPTFFPPAMIPIDHCLISGDAKVRDLKTGPPIGSDHLPLIIDLLVQNTPCCAAGQRLWQKPPMNGAAAV